MIALISHANKEMSKFSKPGLNSMLIMNFQLFKLDRKWRVTRDQIANISWIIEKTRKFQKSIYFYFIDHIKALKVWITAKCEKFLKR